MIPPSCLKSHSWSKSISDVVLGKQAHGVHITWLVVFRCNDPSFMLEVPLMVKVDLVPIDISRFPSKTVQNGSTSTQIPLLDERRVEIDILETHCHLPHLISGPS